MLNFLEFDNNSAEHCFKNHFHHLHFKTLVSPFRTLTQFFGRDLGSGRGLIMRWGVSVSAGTGSQYSPVLYRETVYALQPFLPFAKLAAISFEQTEIFFLILDFTE